MAVVAPVAKTVDNIDVEVSKRLNKCSNKIIKSL